MPEADLYQGKISLCSRCSPNTARTCQEFTARLRKGKAPNVPPPTLTSSCNTLFQTGACVPSMPLVTVPQPVSPGLVRLNDPDEDSLVLATANSRLTFDVLTGVWAQSLTPAFFLLVDCLGNTVDMAVVYGEFSPERLAQAVRASGLENLVRRKRLMVPGLTAALAVDFAGATGWQIEVGPVCAIELPLSLGDRWIPAERR